MSTRSLTQRWTDDAPITLTYASAEVENICLKNGLPLHEMLSCFGDLEGVSSTVRMNGVQQQVNHAILRFERSINFDLFLNEIHSIISSVQNSTLCTRIYLQLRNMIMLNDHQGVSRLEIQLLCSKIVIGMLQILSNDLWNELIDLLECIIELEMPDASFIELFSQLLENNLESFGLCDRIVVLLLLQLGYKDDSTIVTCIELLGSKCPTSCLLCDALLMFVEAEVSKLCQNQRNADDPISSFNFIATCIWMLLLTLTPFMSCESSTANENVRGSRLFYISIQLYHLQEYPSDHLHKLIQVSMENWYSSKVWSQICMSIWHCSLWSLFALSCLIDESPDFVAPTAASRRSNTQTYSQLQHWNQELSDVYSGIESSIHKCQLFRLIAHLAQDHAVLVELHSGMISQLFSLLESSVEDVNSSKKDVIHIAGKGDIPLGIIQPLSGNRNSNISRSKPSSLPVPVPGTSMNNRVPKSKLLFRGIVVEVLECLFDHFGVQSTGAALSNSYSSNYPSVSGSSSSSSNRIYTPGPLSTVHLTESARLLYQGLCNLTRPLILLNHTPAVAKVHSIIPMSNGCSVVLSEDGDVTPFLPMKTLHSLFNMLMSLCYATNDHTLRIMISKLLMLYADKAKSVAGNATPIAPCLYSYFSRWNLVGTHFVVEYKKLDSGMYSHYSLGILMKHYHVRAMLTLVQNDLVLNGTTKNVSLWKEVFDGITAIISMCKSLLPASTTSPNAPRIESGQSPKPIHSEHSLTLLYCFHALYDVVPVVVKVIMQADEAMEAGRYGMAAPYASYNNSWDNNGIAKYRALLSTIVGEISDVLSSCAESLELHADPSLIPTVDQPFRHHSNKRARLSTGDANSINASNSMNFNHQYDRNDLRNEEIEHQYRNSYNDASVVVIPLITNPLYCSNRNMRMHVWNIAGIVDNQMNHFNIINEMLNFPICSQANAFDAPSSLMRDALNSYVSQLVEHVLLTVFYCNFMQLLVDNAEDSGGSTMDSYNPYGNQNNQYSNSNDIGVTESEEHALGCSQIWIRISTLSSRLGSERQHSSVAKLFLYPVLESACLDAIANLSNNGNSINGRKTKRKEMQNNVLNETYQLILTQCADAQNILQLLWESVILVSLIASQIQFEQRNRHESTVLYSISVSGLCSCHIPDPASILLMESFRLFTAHLDLFYHLNRIVLLFFRYQELVASSQTKSGNKNIECKFKEINCINSCMIHFKSMVERFTNQFPLPILQLVLSQEFYLLNEANELELSIESMSSDHGLSLLILFASALYNAEQRSLSMNDSASANMNSSKCHYSSLVTTNVIPNFVDVHELRNATNENNPDEMVGVNELLSHLFVTTSPILNHIQAIHKSTAGNEDGSKQWLENNVCLVLHIYSMVYHHLQYLYTRYLDMQDSLHPSYQERNNAPLFSFVTILSSSLRSARMQQEDTDPMAPNVINVSENSVIANRNPILFLLHFLEQQLLSHTDSLLTVACYKLYELILMIILDTKLLNEMKITFPKSSKKRDQHFGTKQVRAVLLLQQRRILWKISMELYSENSLQAYFVSSTHDNRLNVCNDDEMVVDAVQFALSPQMPSYWYVLRKWLSENQFARLLLDRTGIDSMLYERYVSDHNSDIGKDGVSENWKDSSANGLIFSSTHEFILFNVPEGTKSMNEALGEELTYFNYAFLGWFLNECPAVRVFGLVSLLQDISSLVLNADKSKKKLKHSAYSTVNGFNGLGTLQHVNYKNIIHYYSYVLRLFPLLLVINRQHYSTKQKQCLGILCDPELQAIGGPYVHTCTILLNITWSMQQFSLYMRQYHEFTNLKLVISKTVLVWLKCLLDVSVILTTIILPNAANWRHHPSSDRAHNKSKEVDKGNVKYMHALISTIELFFKDIYQFAYDLNTLFDYSMTNRPDIIFPADIGPASTPSTTSASVSEQDREKLVLPSNVLHAVNKLAKNMDVQGRIVHEYKVNYYRGLDTPRENSIHLRRSALLQHQVELMAVFKRVYYDKNGCLAVVPTPTPGSREGLSSALSIPRDPLLMVKHLPISVMECISELLTEVEVLASPTADPTVGAANSGSHGETNVSHGFRVQLPPNSSGGSAYATPPSGSGGRVGTPTAQGNAQGGMRTPSKSGNRLDIPPASSGKPPVSPHGGAYQVTPPKTGSNTPSNSSGWGIFPGNNSPGVPSAKPNPVSNANINPSFAGNITPSHAIAASTTNTPTTATSVTNNGTSRRRRLVDTPSVFEQL